MGKDDSKPVLCTAKPGDVLEDDMTIILPNGQMKKDRLFFMKETQKGDVFGYYMYKGMRVAHQRTCGHINTSVPPTSQPTKLPRRSARNIHSAQVSKKPKNKVKTKKKTKGKTLGVKRSGTSFHPFGSDSSDTGSDNDGDKKTATGKKHVAATATGKKNIVAATGAGAAVTGKTKNVTAAAATTTTVVTGKNQEQKKLMLQLLQLL